MPDARCVVCGEVVAAGMSATCNWCADTFHLNQRNDIEAKDCGKVWVDEQFMALQFACHACLASGGDAPGARERPEPRSASNGAPAARRRYRRRA